MKTIASFFCILFFACAAIGHAFADSIAIYNLSDHDLWLATYYFDGEKAELVGKIVKSIKNSSVKLERPVWSFWKARELAYAYDRASLTSCVTASNWQNLMTKNISGLQGTEFAIAQNNGIFSVYNQWQWILEKPLQECMNDLACFFAYPFNYILQIDHPAINDNAYHSTQAVVRVGNELHPDEQAFLNNRAPIVKAALEKMLGESLDGRYVPTIALVGSGGGYRAMLCTTGSLVGAEKINLLDATTYISALSGSTWAVGTWYATGLPIKQFRRFIVDKTGRGLEDVTFEDMRLIGEALQIKIAFNQPLTLIDLYGLLLGNVLLSDFGDARHRVYLSHQTDLLVDGKWPYPIYTSVRAEEGAPSNWYEFTPHEVGGGWMQKYTPIWAFGRKFIEGYSIDFAPEQSLSFLMGTWGSAFGANVKQIYESIDTAISSVLVRELIEKIFINDVANDRITCSEMNNFVVGMRKPITQLSLLEMVDAGASPGFNLPYPPISGERSQRKADVLIFLDASASVQGGETLKEVEAYARANNLKFPPINYIGIDTRAISIYKDKNDPDVPVVIYMPRINDPLFGAALNKSEYAHYAPFIRNYDIEKCIASGCCNTMNFKYTHNEAMQLTKLTEFNMLMCRDAIAGAIRWVVNNKS
jgi:hypothetical protein